jgi:RHS repeat-associated protein
MTGHERDLESGLDHTWFRQYSCNTGRWLSPDVVRGTTINPQSWNRYAYVQNNPCNSTDPLGLLDVPAELASREGSCGHAIREAIPNDPDARINSWETFWNDEAGILGLTMFFEWDLNEPTFGNDVWLGMGVDIR